MATKEQIIKFAGSQLGYSRVLADNQLSTESREPLAKQGNLWIDQARDELLSYYPWTFATRRQALISKVFNSVEEVAYESSWTNYYQFPPDCLIIQYIADPAFGTVGADIQEYRRPYSVEINPSAVSTEERRIVLCNFPDAIAIYTTNCIAYEDLPAFFVEPLSILLATKIVMPIARLDENPSTAPLELKAALTRLFSQSISYYTSQDANQDTNRFPRDSETILARSGSSVFVSDTNVVSSV